MNFPWRTALFISLAVNLILISAAIGAFATGARLSRPAEVQEPVAAEALPSRLASTRAFMQALPPETRRTLRRELARELIAMREERNAAREARLALYQAASAEPYDAARVRAAFAAVREADAVLLAGFHNALADGLARISETDRAAALEAMQRGRPIREEGVEPAPDGAEPTREERRQRMRERWRERRKQRQQN